MSRPLQVGLLMLEAAMLWLCLAMLPGHALDLDDLQQQFDDATGGVQQYFEKYEKISDDISTKEEIDIGANLTAGLLGAAPLVKNRKLQRYVNDVGFWVARQTERRKLPWRFGVIDSQGINAFAAPGGHVVITLGLYQLLENEAQLAGVLAHEIAHVVRKHHLKALQKSMKREFWSDLGVQAIDDEVDPKIMRKLVDSGMQLYTSGLDRKFEFDADLRAVVLLARAGYDPYAFLDVLTTIDSISPDSAELTVLMNTHPPTDDRLVTLAERMEGELDSYATGLDNADRFRRLAAAR